MRRLFLLISFFSLTGCYTIHFTNGSNMPTEYTYSQWHHIGLLGLMEFSAPVNLKSICKENNWKAVKTETGFLQGLMRMISIPLGSYGYGEVQVPTAINIGTFYSPESVSIACKN